MTPGNPPDCTDPGLSALLPAHRIVTRHVTGVATPVARAGPVPERPIEREPKATLGTPDTKLVARTPAHRYD